MWAKLLTTEDTEYTEKSGRGAVEKHGQSSPLLLCSTTPLPIFSL
jgi:hypothetical protein